MQCFFYNVVLFLFAYNAKSAHIGRFFEYNANLAFLRSDTPLTAYSVYAEVINE